MNKKAIVTEALVRIVIAIVALAVVGTILVQCYNKLAYSDAEKRFDTFVDVIRSLKDGETKQQMLSLDEKGALIGFTKNSDAILFDATSDSQWPRPAICAKGESCVCICSNLRYKGENLFCDGSLKCSKLSLELPSTYTPENFMPIPGPALIYGYTITNGFIIDRSVPSDDTLFPSPKTRQFTLSLIRIGDNLRICHPDTCTVSS